MAVSADYVVRETAANLWRNRLMTVAAVLTVAICLGLVGATLLLRQGASNAEVLWQRGNQVVVWMNPTASPTELHAVSTEINSVSYVHDCVFRAQRYDYEEALKLLPADVSDTLTVAKMPSSYRCVPNQPDDAQLVLARFGGQPGVYKVTAPYQSYHTMQEWITGLQIAFITIAAILGISAFVLILNTIRMAIFARRREVSVMKLVGATNWFIRVPFMSEGLVQGLIGSLVAAALVFGLHDLLDVLGNPNNPGSVLTQMRMSGWEVFWTEVVVIVLGTVIGTSGSLIAIGRFLDV